MPSIRRAHRLAADGAHPRRRTARMGMDMDFSKIEEELVDQRATVDKVVDKGGETLEQRVGHKSEIEKGEQELSSFLDKRAAADKPQ
jgi:hypothetical protein